MLTLCISCLELLHFLPQFALLATVRSLSQVSLWVCTSNFCLLLIFSFCFFPDSHVHFRLQKISAIHICDFLRAFISNEWYWFTFVFCCGNWSEGHSRPDQLSVSFLCCFCAELAFLQFFQNDLLLNLNMSGILTRILCCLTKIWRLKVFEKILMLSETGQIHCYNLGTKMYAVVIWGLKFTLS